VSECRETRGNIREAPGAYIGAGVTKGGQEIGQASIDRSAYADPRSAMQMWRRSQKLEDRRLDLPDDRRKLRRAIAGLGRRGIYPAFVSDHYEPK
jgi:hypothetical protein